LNYFYLEYFNINRAKPGIPYISFTLHESSLGQCVKLKLP